MKAFLGMGLLGSNFVKAMLRRGDEVKVWNRTYSKAQALANDGAKAFENLADAVKDVDVVHLTLKDDDTVNEILALAEQSLKPGATIIDHTTTSAKGAVERTAAWKAKGFTYLHAPVFMGPSNALEATGYMLVSGNIEAIGKVQAELTKMTGKLLNVGPEEGRAAGLKLIGNQFLLSMTTALADTLALARALDVPATAVAELFGAWNPGAGMPARFNKLMAGDFDQPSWELAMARKDAGIMLSTAEDADRKLILMPAIAEEMDRWIEKGCSHKDWSVIAKDSL